MNNMELISKVLKKLKTLYQLTYEYKNISFLILSLADYLKVKHSKISERLEERLQIHRLPNGLQVAILSEPRYLRSYISTFGEIYIMRIYEKLNDFIPDEEDTILDLGAFIGLYTLKHFRAKQIFAIEPHPISYSLLAINVKLNKLEHVKCLNYAIWNHSAIIPLYEGNFLIAGSTLMSGLHERLYSKQILVKAISLDQLVDQGIISKYIDIAKVDIEGAEVQFLEGGVKTLTQGYVNRVVMEVHKNLVDLRVLYAKLRELGFRIVHKIPGYNLEIVYMNHVR